MSGPLLAALLLSLFTLFVFFVIGYYKRREISTVDDYFLYGRGLDSKGYSATFVATSISLATVLFFFLDFSGPLGLALLLSPLMYCLGCYVFLKILPRLKDLGYLENGTTLHNFIGQSFGSPALRISAAIVSMLGYIGILIIEIHVGICIFKIFDTSQTWILLAGFFILSLVFVYTYLGGYRAVVDTDKIQLTLIAFGSVFSLAYLAYLHITTEVKVNVFSFEKLAPFPWLLPLPFIVVMVLGNVPFQFLRMSNWLRAAAVNDLKATQSGLKKSIVFTFLAWVFFSFIGLLFFGINPDSTGNGQAGIGLLTLLRDASGLFSSYVAFPLLFVGMIAAMVSTADSVLMPILTSYIFDFRYHEKLHTNELNALKQVDSKINNAALKCARLAIPMFLLLAVGIYFTLTELVGFEFVDLLFVFFNQQLVLFPVVVLSLRGNIHEAKPFAVGALFGLWIGWCVAWGFAIYGRLTGSPDLVLYSSFFALLASIVVTIAFNPVRIIKYLKKRR